MDEWNKQYRAGFEYGWTPVTHAGEKPCDTGISFGILRMRAGEELSQVTTEETAFLLMEGSVAVTPPGQSTPAYSQPGGATVAGSNQALVTVGNTDVRYPHLLEFGTTRTPAQPFFWPGFRLSRKRAENRIKRAISKAIKEAK